LQYAAKLKLGATAHVPLWRWTWMYVWREKFNSAVVR